MSRTDRNETVERLLRQSLTAASADATPACLDAETLAVWVDGGLTGGALEQAETHLASCARCQALVAVLVRTDQPTVVVEHSYSLAPWLAWLVPAAATAAVAVGLVWLAVPHQNAPSPAQTSAEVASPDRQAELSRDLTPQRKDATPAQGAAAPAVAPPVESPEARASGGTVQPVAPRARVESDALESRQAQQASGGVGRGEPVDALKSAAENAATPKVEAFAQPAAAAPPAPPPPSSAPPAATAPSGTVGGLEAASGPPPSRPIAPGTAGNARAAATPPPAASARLERSVSGNLLADAVGPREVLIVSPTTAIRWRLTGNAILRSTNSGVGWTQVFTGSVPLISGHSPSAQVCWVIGRGGLILRSADGVAFARVTSPAVTELATVTATDANAAQVTTTDGRTFATRDGGQTWESRLQEF